MWASGRIATIATAMTPSEINRSDQGARLKKNHHSRITRAKSTPPKVEINMASMPPISRLGTTAGRINLKNTSSTAAVTPGQRRRGLGIFVTRT